MKFDFHNDTGRAVSVHPATAAYGTTCDMSVIQPLEVRTFTLPTDTYPSVKLWDYGEERGLSIFVSPVKLT